MMTLGFSSLAMVFAIGIGASATNHSPRVIKMLESKFLRFFGKYSYAMYIFHTFILGWLITVFPSPDSGVSLFAAGVPRIVAFTAIGIFLTSVAGVVSWVLFESHVLKLKKYFELKRA